MNIKDLSPQDRAALMAQAQEMNALQGLAHALLDAYDNKKTMIMNLQLQISQGELRIMVAPENWAEPYLMLRTLAARANQEVTKTVFDVYDILRNIRPLDDPKYLCPPDLLPEGAPPPSPPAPPPQVEGEATIPAEVVAGIANLMAGGKLKLQGNLDVEHGPRPVDLTSAVEDRE